MQNSNFKGQGSFEKISGKRLFSFAVISDTHLTQKESECNSPFKVNCLANGRMRNVIHSLNNNSSIAFVIHLGDLIHPVPEVEDLYLAAAKHFHEQIDGLIHPIYLVPGNHDIGDKFLRWSPAIAVNEKYIELYKNTFGKHYYSFNKYGCHFVVINAQIINSGLKSEMEQKKWLEQDLKSNSAKRIFMNTHYPPFISNPLEEEHYDNIAESERSWLLNLLESHKVETLFCGHVHNFWYLRYKNTDCYLLPSLSFVRQDYSEMFKAPPPPEFQSGRNDYPKLGYFVVHVYETGHVCHFIRTYGHVAEIGCEASTAQEKINSLSPCENFRAPLGFDLRESWAETIGIAPSGGLDEFDRKEVHNDYPLLALWEMGVRKLRIPLQDIRKVATRDRIREIGNYGHAFTLFSYGIPNKSDYNLVLENSDLFNSWELGFDWPNIDEFAADIKNIFAKTNLQIYLSKLWSHDQKQNFDEPFYHVINHGFTTSDSDQIDRLKNSLKPSEVLSGVVFRLENKESIWETIHTIEPLCRQRRLKASVHLKMTGSNPAQSTCNDLWTANRIAEALFSIIPYENISVYIDTLVDVDRGYFVRNGVLDRLCNPRLGARVLQNLYSVINNNHECLSSGERNENSNGFWMTLIGKQVSYLLFIPNPNAIAAEIFIPHGWKCNSNVITKTSLATGEISKVSVRKTTFKIEIEEHLRGPVIFSFER